MITTPKLADRHPTEPRRARILNPQVQFGLERGVGSQLRLGEPSCSLTGPINLLTISMNSSHREFVAKTDRWSPQIGAFA